MIWQTVKAKYALSPIPADRTNGRLATRPIMTDASADASAVAVKTAPESIPEADRIPGLTARI